LIYSQTIYRDGRTNYYHGYIFDLELRLLYVITRFRSFHNFLLFLLIVGIGVVSCDGRLSTSTISTQSSSISRLSPIDDVINFNSFAKLTKVNDAVKRISFRFVINIPSNYLIFAGSLTESLVWCVNFVRFVTASVSAIYLYCLHLNGWCSRDIFLRCLHLHGWWSLHFFLYCLLSNYWWLRESFSLDEFFSFLKAKKCQNYWKYFPLKLGLLRNSRFVTDGQVVI